MREQLKRFSASDPTAIHLHAHCGAAGQEGLAAECHVDGFWLQMKFGWVLEGGASGGWSGIYKLSAQGFEAQGFRMRNALPAGITLMGQKCIFQLLSTFQSGSSVAARPRELPRDLHINSISSVSPHMAFRTVLYFLIAMCCIGALLYCTRIGSTRSS